MNNNGAGINRLRVCVLVILKAKFFLLLLNQFKSIINLLFNSNGKSRVESIEIRA